MIESLNQAANQVIGTGMRYLVYEVRNIDHRIAA
jgi:hypothetical protein